MEKKNVSPEASSAVQAVTSGEEEPEGRCRAVPLSGCSEGWLLPAALLDVIYAAVL